MESLAPAMALVLVLAIPIIAIVGGIVHGIVRTVGRQRLVELAQRERIAALERGINPKDLPPFQPPGPVYGTHDRRSFAHAQRWRRQSIRIGGVVVLFTGIGVGLPLILLGNEAGWIPGTLLSMIGLSLLIASSLITDNGNGHGPERRDEPEAGD